MVLQELGIANARLCRLKWLQVVALLPEGAWRWQRELSSEARAPERWRGRVGSIAAGVGRDVT